MNITKTLNDTVSHKESERTRAFQILAQLEEEDVLGLLMSLSRELRKSEEKETKNRTVGFMQVEL